MTALVMMLTMSMDLAVGMKRFPMVITYAISLMATCTIPTMDTVIIMVRLS